MYISVGYMLPLGAFTVEGVSSFLLLPTEAPSPSSAGGVEWIARRWGAVRGVCRVT